MIKKYFTLIEIIVVIIIIASLAAIVTPCALNAIHNAKISRMANDLKAIRKGALAYYIDTGYCPNTRGGGGDATSQALMYNVWNHNGWEGPYLDSWPIVPWGDDPYFIGGISGNIFNSTGLIAREYIIYVVRFTDTDVINKIDAIIDDGDINKGYFRYITIPLPIIAYLISRDGPVD